MSREELEKELKAIQEKLDDNMFLVVEKECIEIYRKEEFVPTPMPNNLTGAV